MATEKQMEANRRNAALSTGPKTEEGKAQSRANAVTHGLTAKSFLPKEQQEAAEKRYSAWTLTFRPEDEYQECELACAVEASLRVENCRLRERERKIKLAEVAEDPGTKWESDRQQEAARLARSLKRNPEVVALQLRSTPAGREWLIRAWKLLLVAVAERERPAWTLTESNDALDLLGHPKSRRTLYLERMKPFSDPETTRALIVKEIAALEAEQETAAEENAQLRRQHVEGLIFESDSSLTLIRRYETSARRQLDKSLRAIKQMKTTSKPARSASVALSENVEAPTTSDYETNPNAPSAEIPVVASSEPPDCETKPIAAPATPPTVKTDPVPRVETGETVPKKLPGNRRHRRKLEKQGLLEAYLARHGV